MLKTLDILLGLSVVMLMVSLIVTVLTEAVTNLLQMRGKHLLQGVIGLLRQVDRDLPEHVVEVVATTILTHPLIRSHGSRFGSVIHREELTKLVLELAADEGPQRLTPEILAQLTEMLKRNGIVDPKKTLENVRALALQLELSHPELSNNLRYSTAFVQEANSRFVAKIHGWFDQTIDRVSDRFTRATRIVTFCGSLLIALVLQLDTAQLVNRLSEDPNLRGELVKQAIAVDRGNLTPGPEKSPSLLPTFSDPDRKRLRDLVQDDIIEFPTSIREWTGRWTLDNFFMKLVGIILTATLLSLGAPFWYGALKNLIRLRSLIAQKDDEQRETRQKTQVALITGAQPPTTVDGTGS
ncbi:MAG: hypothetical protein ACJ746_07325 [Bryobacteraceae bacterium]